MGLIYYGSVYFSLPTTPDLYIHLRPHLIYQLIPHTWSRCTWRRGLGKSHGWNQSGTPLNVQKRPHFTTWRSRIRHSNDLLLCNVKMCFPCCLSACPPHPTHTDTAKTVNLQAGSCVLPWLYSDLLHSNARLSPSFNIVCYCHLEIK